MPRITRRSFGASSSTSWVNLHLPPSGEELLAPSDTGSDEEHDWFLDNFSPRELERFISRSRRAPLRDVRWAATFSGTICLVTGYLAVQRGSAGGPGAIVSLTVFSSGFALAMFLFHLLRVEPARRLAAGVIPTTAVQLHLENCRHGRV